MAARRDNVKDLFSVAPFKLSQEKEDAQRRRQEYAAELQAQIQAKEQSRRSEREASLRQSRQLLEFRQGAAGSSWDRAADAAQVGSPAWESSLNKPTAGSAFGRPFDSLNEGHHPIAHPWGHQEHMSGQEVDAVPEPLDQHGWQRSQEQLPARVDYTAGSCSPAWGAASRLPKSYAGSSFSRSSLEGLPVVPGTSFNPLEWSAGGMPALQAANYAGGSHFQLSPGGGRPSLTSHGSGMPPSHRPEGYSAGYSEVPPGMGHGGQRGFPLGSEAPPLPNRAWDRYGAPAGALPPVAAMPRLPQNVAPQSGTSLVRAGAAASAPFVTDLQQGDGWSRRPSLQYGARNPGYAPVSPVSGQGWLASPAKLVEEEWGVASPGKLSAFGSADEEKRRKEEARKASYKAELEAQMQAKQDRQKKEKTERMKEDLRKEKEIASFGGMGLPGRAGGYGGGSGPLRDDQGNIVTDLNKVRKYQQKQQVAKSLSASQATLQQLDHELQLADGNSPGGTASLTGATYRDQPAHPSAGTGPRDGRPRQHSMEAQGSDSWQLQHGRAEGLPSYPAREGPAWPDQHEPLLASAHATPDGGNLQRASSQSYQPTSTAGYGEHIPNHQQASAAEARGSSVVDGPDEARVGNNWRVAGGAAVAATSMAAAAKRGSNAAFGGNVTVNLRSDHPYMTANDVERKQQQQESWKAALQQQMEEKRRKKEEELRREKELDAAEEQRLAKEQERLREAFERERGPQRCGKKEQASSVGAATMESDGIMIKFKPPPASRQPPQQQPAAAVGHAESSPGIEIKFKPPPAGAAHDEKQGGSGGPHEVPVTSGSHQRGPSRMGSLQPGQLDHGNGSSVAVQQAWQHQESPAWPDLQLSGGMEGAGGLPSQAGAGLASGPWVDFAGREAGINADNQVIRGSGPGQHVSAGSQGVRIHLGHQYEVAAGEDSIRAALAVQRREMQELRERAAAAEFNSSAARRQLESLTDMVRWQGAGAGGVSGAYPVPFAQQQLQSPMLAPGPGAGYHYEHQRATGSDLAAGPGGFTNPQWHASGMRGPVPVYETVSALRQSDSRPSTASSLQLEPLDARMFPATQNAAMPVFSGTLRGPLSREELVEPSLTGVSSLIFLPQTALRPSNSSEPNMTGGTGSSQDRSQSKLGVSRPISGRPPLPPPPRQQQQQQQHPPLPAGSPRPLIRSRTAGAAGSPRSILPLPPLMRRATMGHGPAAGSNGSASGGSWGSPVASTTQGWDQLQSSGPDQDPSPRARASNKLEAIAGSAEALLPLSRQGSFSARRRTSRFAAEQLSSTAPAEAWLPAEVPEDEATLRPAAKADIQGPDSKLEELDQFILGFGSAGAGL